MSRGQALVELAVCTPVVMLLAFGAVAGVQVIDAAAGLDAATKAAAAEAARAPDPASAETAARERFQSIVASYPLSSAQLSLSVGTFARGDAVLATASGTIDLAWAELVVPKRLTLESHCTIPVESWRSRPHAS
jgi:Flp pilus assembly protein TadG